MLFGFLLTGLVISALVEVFSLLGVVNPLDQSYSVFTLTVVFGLGIAACLLLFIGVEILLVKAVVKPLAPLPTWMYLRILLSVPATWQDAKITSFLFESYNDLGRWYPLTELRDVPHEFRREVLLGFAERMRFANEVRSGTRPHPTAQTPPKTSADPAPPSDDPRILRARKVLGVGPRSSAEDIKKAFRQLIRKYHPDVYAKSQPELQQFAHEKATEIIEAYEALNGTQNGDTSYM